MKAYLAKLARDYDTQDEIELPPEALKKITGRLIPGAKCAWCYQSDVEFWKKERIAYPHPKEWPYQGFIIPFPDTDGRNGMEIEHVCLVVISYPIEKENPLTDWSLLLLLLQASDLHRFYVFETVSTAANWEPPFLSNTSAPDMAKEIAQLKADKAELLEASKAACAAAADCLPIQGESELDALYYKSKLLAIDAAAGTLSNLIAKHSKI